MIRVDRLKAHPRRVGRLPAGTRWCHMFVASPAELPDLHAFAARIGCAASWFQPDGGRLPHYDLPKERRDRALRGGAGHRGRGQGGHPGVAGCERRACRLIPAFDQDGVRLFPGDTLQALRALPAESTQMCLTSPPYYGLRRYLAADHPLAARELGREETPEEYVERLVEVFAEVHRILRPDGVLFLNLGDSYSHGGCGARDPVKWPKQSRNDHMPKHAKRLAHSFDPKYPLGRNREANEANRGGQTGLPPKSLLGIPWRVAFALQAAGWLLRADIIWAKPSPMPSSVTDRPTSAHEYVFLLAKQRRYFYDAKAIRERAVHGWGNARSDTAPLEPPGQKPQASLRRNRYQAPGQPPHQGLHPLKLDGKKVGAGRRDADFTARWEGKNERLDKREYAGFNGRWDQAEAEGADLGWRNKRDVWTIGPEPFREGDHFAVMPSELARTCILAGSKPSNGGGEFGRVRSGGGPLQRRWHHPAGVLPTGPARHRLRDQPRLPDALRPAAERGHAAAAAAAGGGQ